MSAVPESCAVTNGQGRMHIISFGSLNSYSSLAMSYMPLVAPVSIIQASGSLL